MGNIQPELDQLEHFDRAFGFPSGKSVAIVEGVPTDVHKANATINHYYSSLTSYGQRVFYTDMYVLSGTTITRFRKNYGYTGGDLTSESAWTLV